MPRKSWKRRTLIIATMTVALSIGIVFASVPYLPHPPPPHLSVSSPISQNVPAPSSQGYPGTYALKIPGLTSNQNFFVGVNVTGGIAGFCVIDDGQYQSWALSGTPSNNTFPAGSCILQERTAQAVLQFIPTHTGTWDIIVLNNNPKIIRVDFSPA